MASSRNVMSGTEQQVELWIELKEKVDLVYKQLNQYRGACRSVDRLNRAVRRTGGQLDPDRMLTEFIKFERDYRVSRKRLRKLDRQLLAVNLYDKLYDLYESLVMEESIGSGGDLIDSSAIDKAVVDEVGCNGPVGTEDTPVDDFANIQIDFNPADCLEIQLDTIQPKISNTSIDSSSFLMTDVSDSAQVNSFEFQCSKCDKSFNTSSNLRRHKWTHESEPRFKCSWEGCGYCTYVNYKLKAHQAVHTGKYRFKCSWEGCDFGTYYSQAFKDHQTVHTGERLFQCPQCEKTFKTSSYLTRHKRAHESEPRFKCNLEGCDFGSHHLVHLTRHQDWHLANRI